MFFQPGGSYSMEGGTKVTELGSEMRFQSSVGHIRWTSPRFLGPAATGNFLAIDKAAGWRVASFETTPDS